MSAKAVTMEDRRPLRDLLRPEVEQPMNAGHVPERRRDHRYSRCLLGTMTAGEHQFPVACVDVSFGGAQVVTPEALKLAKGDRVTVRINHGPWSYQDDFCVVQSESMPAGTAVHLQLS